MRLRGFDIAQRQGAQLHRAPGRAQSLAQLGQATSEGAQRDRILDRDRELEPTGLQGKLDAHAAQARELEREARVHALARGCVSFAFLLGLASPVALDTEARVGPARAILEHELECRGIAGLAPRELQQLLGLDARQRGLGRLLGRPGRQLALRAQQQRLEIALEHAQQLGAAQRLATCGEQRVLVREAAAQQSFAQLFGAAIGLEHVLSELLQHAARERTVLARGEPAQLAREFRERDRKRLTPSDPLAQCGQQRRLRRGPGIENAQQPTFGARRDAQRELLSDVQRKRSARSDALSFDAEQDHALTEALQHATGDDAPFAQDRRQARLIAQRVARGDRDQVDCCGRVQTRTRGGRARRRAAGAAAMIGSMSVNLRGSAAAADVPGPTPLRDAPRGPQPRARMAALACALLASAAGALQGCGGGEGPRPNVLVISIDTLRADHLASYGYARATSPNIDRLAREGVLCERAWSTSSWTLPAHLSMLTGLSASAHGVCDERLWDAIGKPGYPAQLPLRGSFLPEVLRGAGYATAGFYCWKYLEPRFAFGPGFDVYERIDRTVWSDPELSAREQRMRTANDVEGLKAWMAAEPELFDDQRPFAAHAVDRALGWIEGRAGNEQPFFMFLHLFDVHDAYVPPAPYDKAFTDPAYAGPIDGRQVSSPKSLVQPGMLDEDLAQLVALYDGEIAWTDAQIGRLLAKLDELGMAQDTLIVLSSDHGEEFFEHGGKTHRAQLYGESVRVPLVWRWPAGLPAGQRVRVNTGIVDIAPTIYELLELEAPAGLSGARLASELRGGAQDAEREYASELLVFGAKGYTPERKLSLARGDEQLLMHVPRDGGVPELLRFDARTDPWGHGAGERLRADGPEAKQFAARLVALRERTSAERESSRGRRVAIDALSAEERARQERELQKAGYLGTEGGPEPGSARSGLCFDGCVWPAH